MAHAARLLGIIALVAFVLGPAIAHFELVAPLVGFGVFALGILLAVIATILGVLALLRGAPGLRSTALAGLVLGLLVIGVTVAVARRGSGVPRINDITTDTENPPQLRPAPRRCRRTPGATWPTRARSSPASSRRATPNLAGPAPRDAARSGLLARRSSRRARMETWTITREDAAGSQPRRLRHDAALPLQGRLRHRGAPGRRRQRRADALQVARRQGRRRRQRQADRSRSSRRLR